MICSAADGRNYRSAKTKVEAGQVTEIGDITKGLGRLVFDWSVLERSAHEGGSSPASDAVAVSIWEGQKLLQGRTVRLAELPEVLCEIDTRPEIYTIRAVDGGEAFVAVQEVGLGQVEHCTPTTPIAPIALKPLGRGRFDPIEGARFRILDTTGELLLEGVVPQGAITSYRFVNVPPGSAGTITLEGDGVVYEGTFESSPFGYPKWSPLRARGAVPSR